MEYTYETFKGEFENSSSPEEKQNILIKLLDSGLDVREYKEEIQEYRAQLKDLRDQMEKEEDEAISKAIENGEFKLYTCIEDVNDYPFYKSGEKYYVKIDGIKRRYTESIAGDESFVKDLDPKIQEYISGLKDLIWIVQDNGIGSLKRKNLVRDFDFSKHFTL